jgi:hypothetical protein
MGRIENPDLNDYGASLGWHSTSSIRAKWRSLSSARASTLKKDLTQSGIVREAIFHQLKKPTNATIACGVTKILRLARMDFRFSFLYRTPCRRDLCFAATASVLG